MYPSLKAPVIGSELMLLNLTVLHRPRRAGTESKRVLLAGRCCGHDLQRGGMLERGQVEECCNPLQVEQVQFLGSAREADGNHRFPGEKGMLLPPFEGNVCQNVVITDDYVWRPVACQRLRGIDSDGVGGYDSHFGEIPRDVLTEKAVTRDA